MGATEPMEPKLYETRARMAEWLRREGHGVRGPFDAWQEGSPTSGNRAYAGDASSASREKRGNCAGPASGRG